MAKCPTCGQPNLKNPDDPRHVKGKRHQEALEKRGITSTSRAKPAVSRIDSPTSVSIGAFEKRLRLVEDQIKFIMNKITTIDVKIADIQPTSQKVPNLSPIKNRIKKLIPRGESMSIDELNRSLSQSGYDWRMIEQALIDMVDDEVFDVSEGRSRTKIAGNIGRLIRR